MINELHRQVWTRYVRKPYGHLLDYADAEGNTVLPAASEELPNPLAWGLPIENGAFFGGLYLYSLCEDYDRTPKESTREEIRLLAKGLFLLCDVSTVDGFIARGVCEDGVSHPPYSSDDQVGPWLLGLWRLYRSSASEEAMKEQIRSRLCRTLQGLRRLAWRIPTEQEGVFYGSFAATSFRSAAKGMLCVCLERALGLIGEEELCRFAEEHPDGGVYSRAQILSHGFAPDMIRNTGLIQLWIHLCAQLCTRELCLLDPSREASYRQGLRLNGAVATEFFSEYEGYFPHAREKRSCDWRVLQKDARREEQPAAIVEEAGRQLRSFFAEHSPRMRYEKKFLAPSLFACWIAVVSTDPVAAERGYRSLCEIAKRVDWQECGYGFAFAAEGALLCYEG